MKIALTTSGKDLNAPLDLRFGRAARFLVYDTETKTFEIEDNSQNLNAPQGAGIQSAQNVAGMGVDIVISGHCGPKLSASNIAVFPTTSATVSEAIEQYKQGSLTATDAADVPGHWN